MLFKEFDLCEEVQDGIRDMGFSEATEIQEKAIPIALSGKNMLGTSFTGSGKTAAFVLPIIDQIFKSKQEGIQALVLAPTRELAQQIDEQFWSLGYHAGISSVCVYGGSDWSDQEKAMKAGVNVIVATPGRLLDQMKITSYDFSKIRYLVLDEADRMLDMGFLPDVRSIINRIPNERQTLLFSATTNDRIENLAKEFTNGSFERIKVGRIAPAQGIHQVYYKVGDQDKKDLLLHLYKEQQWHSAIVFASTKRGVDVLSRSLGKMGVAVDSIHGDRDQKEREFTLDKFRSGKIKVLVATDVMARGIDVDDISHIINYDVPNDLDDYIHRIGRTARAKSTGNAITFVSRRDWKSMLDIIDAKELDIKEEPVPDEVMAKSKGEDDKRGSSRGRSSSSDRSGRGGGSSRRSRQSSKPREDKADAPPKKEEKVAPDDKDSAASDDSVKPVADKKEKPAPRRKPQSKPRRREPKAQDSGTKGADADKGETSKAEPKDKKPPARSKPKRRPAAKKLADKGGKADETSGKPKSKPSPRAKKAAGSSRRSPSDSARGAKGKVPAEKQKHIKKQEKLIEQVQQSSIPDSDKGKKSDEPKQDKKGIWGTIKKLFD